MSSDNNTPDENSNNINNGELTIENTFTPANEIIDNIPAINDYNSNAESTITLSTKNIEPENIVQISTPSPASSRRTSKSDESLRTSTSQ